MGGLGAKYPSSVCKRVSRKCAHALRLCARGQCPACGDFAFGLVRQSKASGQNPPSFLTHASGLEVYLLATFCHSCLRLLICFGSNFVRASRSTECHPSRKFPGLAAGQIWSCAARVVGGGAPPSRST